MLEIKIPRMIINIMHENTMLPFFIIGAPNISNDYYISWLFSGRTSQTLTCTGPITDRQRDYFQQTRTTGEILYKNQKFKFQNGYITDIIEGDMVPLSINNIQPMFYRPYNEYIIFYFLLVNGLNYIE